MWCLLGSLPRLIEVRELVPFFEYGVVIWSLIPFVILWSMWKERNDRIFKWASKSMHELKSSAVSILAKWVSSRSEFDSLAVDGIFHKWGVTIASGLTKMRKVIKRLLLQVVNWNSMWMVQIRVTKALREFEGRGLFLHNSHGYGNVGTLESYEKGVLAILEALWLYVASFCANLVVELWKAIRWLQCGVSSSRASPLEVSVFHFSNQVTACVNSGSFQVCWAVSKYACRLLAKQGVNRSFPFVVFSL